MIIDRLKYITEQEKLKIPDNKSDDFFETLFFISCGDLRKAINTLQSAVALELLENLDINEVLKISGFVDKPTLEDLIEAMSAIDFIRTKEILANVENFDSRNFIRQILGILPKLKIEQKDLIYIYIFLGEIDYRISQGADEQIQILALMAEIIDKIVK